MGTANRNSCVFEGNACQDEKHREAVACVNRDTTARSAPHANRLHMSQAPWRTVLLHSLRGERVCMRSAHRRTSFSLDTQKSENNPEQQLGAREGGNTR